MRSPRRALLLAVGILLVASPSVQAQSAARLRVGITAPTVPPSGGLVDLKLRMANETSHWKTGLLVGALLGALVGNLMLETGSSGGKRLGVTLAAATPTGAIGALIGGLFPKRENGE